MVLNSQDSGTHCSARSPLTWPLEMLREEMGISPKPQPPLPPPPDLLEEHGLGAEGPQGKRAALCWRDILCVL